MGQAVGRGRGRVRGGLGAGRPELRVGRWLMRPRGAGAAAITADTPVRLETGALLPAGAALHAEYSGRLASDGQIRLELLRTVAGDAVKCDEFHAALSVARLVILEWLTGGHGSRPR